MWTDHSQKSNRIVMINNKELKNNISLSITVSKPYNNTIKSKIPIKCVYL